MFVPVAEPDNRIEPTQRLKAFKKQLDSNQPQPWQQLYLLQGVIESFVDGILILSDRGEWVYANSQARRICQQLLQDPSRPNSVAQEIWRVCQSLSESHELFPEQRIIIESEVDTDSTVTYRIRARWLELSDTDRRFLLVTLEDRHQSTENVALADIKKYRLTRREAEVWLLRRSNHSYKEIAAKLYITPNTVKRHLKNIYAKQRESLWSE